MLPNVISVTINILMAHATDEFLATKQGELYDTSASFGIKALNARSSVLFELHAKPLQDADAGCHAIVIDKCRFLLVIGKLQTYK